MEVKTYIPHPALQPFVLSISTVNALLPEGMREAVSPYPPTPFQSLMFYCNHPISMGRVGGIFQKQPCTVLIGPQVSRVNIKVHDQLRALRVDFVPGGMHRMFGLPMHELLDKGLDTFDLLGPGIGRLNDRLQNTGSLEEAKSVVEDFLMEQVRNGRSLLPFDHAIRSLMEEDGNMPIERVASLSCLSLKQFERNCRDRIGMSPKMFARILRFSKAYRLHEAMPQLSWTSIAHASGYFDQMHMIRDFRVFAGVNPSVIEKQLLSTPLRMQKDLGY
jgi:AraC-like DNA-binding protein